MTTRDASTDDTTSAIRSAIAGDWACIEALLAANRDVYPGFEAWLKVTRSAIDAGRGFCLVSIGDRLIDGVAIVKPKADGRQKLSTLYVLPSHRGRGVGRALLEAVTQHWESCGTSRAFVTARRGGEPRLRRLLANHGFVHIATALDRYGPDQHEDVYEWRKPAHMALGDPTRICRRPVRRQQAL